MCFHIRSLVLKVASVLAAPALVCCMYTAALADDAELTLINPNSASVEMLSKLPGMNTELAMSVVTFREMMGDMRSPEELLEINGFSEDLLNQIKPFISMDSLSTDCGC